MLKEICRLNVQFSWDKTAGLLSRFDGIASPMPAPLASQQLQVNVYTVQGDQAPCSKHPVGTKTKGCVLVHGPHTKTELLF